MASDAVHEPPELQHDLGEQAPFDILGKRIVAAAIKGVSQGEARLRPGALLLLMMEDGSVAVFDNTDHSIATTGGLNNGGWQGAVDYMSGSMRIVHQYHLEEVDGKIKKVGEKADYL